jgi:hypothetical protein
MLRRRWRLGVEQGDKRLVAVGQLVVPANLIVTMRQFIVNGDEVYATLFSVIVPVIVD